MKNRLKKFTNAVVYGHKDANEILVENGVIKAIGRDLGPADEEIDLGGKLVTAPYVDPHLHLDYVYTLSELGKQGAGSGTLFEAIEMWPKFKATFTVEGVKNLPLRESTMRFPKEYNTFVPKQMLPIQNSQL